jgi:hypothetical protein
LTTNVFGVAITKLVNGEYNYTVSKPGYYDIEGSFVINNVDIDMAVNMEQAEYAITFSAKHNGTPLQGVTIQVDDKVLTTDMSGNAVVQLVSGSYTYTAKKDGYNDLEGSFVVNNADKTIFVNMAVGIEGAIEDFVRLYPNPVESTLTIDRNSSDEVVIELYNISGVLVGTTNTEKATTTIDVKTLSPGTYFIRVTGVNNTTTHKFIKQ